MQITRSTNGMTPKNESGRSSDTMGTKHFVEYGVYVVYGSINAYFAEKTGFSDEDMAILKEAILTLFENDLSSARPEGSMIIRELFWFTHSSKLGDISSAKIQDLIQWEIPEFDNNRYADFGIHLEENKLNSYKEKGLKLEIFEGV